MTKQLSELGLNDKTLKVLTTLGIKSQEELLTDAYMTSPSYSILSAVADVDGIVKQARRKVRLEKPLTAYRYKNANGASNGIIIKTAGSKYGQYIPDNILEWILKSGLTLEQAKTLAFEEANNA